MVDLPIPILPVSPICIGAKRAVDRLEEDIKTISEETFTILWWSDRKDGVKWRCILSFMTPRIEYLWLAVFILRVYYYSISICTYTRKNSKTGLFLHCVCCFLLLLLCCCCGSLSVYGFQKFKQIVLSLSLIYVYVPSYKPSYCFWKEKQALAIRTALQ